MPCMRGLTIVVAAADAERFHAALTLASAQAALGCRARIYLHANAVRLLHSGPALLVTAQELGVTLIACQTGLADAGIALPDGVEAGGMVSLLADIGDDRLVMA